MNQDKVGILAERALFNVPLPKIRSEARTHSAISVVNALATGRGAAIGIGLDCKVRAILTKNRSARGTPAIEVANESDDAHSLVRTCVVYSLSYLGKKVPEGYSLRLRVTSRIPSAVGLKSSSAVSTAVVKSVLTLLKDRTNPKEILDISCAASKACAASLTGAYDDAAACLLGGMQVTDNANFRILKQSRVPLALGSFCLVLVPKKEKRFTSSVDLSRYSRFKRESADAFKYALARNIPEAMILNSIVQCAALGYSFKPISEALVEGASCAGITGKGPGVAALCSSKRIARRISKAWTEGQPNSRVILTRVVQLSRTNH